MACISYNGSAVWGDFYMNASPGQSWCRAWLEVRTTNVGSQSSQAWYLARNGHYGPLRVVVNTAPPCEDATEPFDLDPAWFSASYNAPCPRRCSGGNDDPTRVRTGSEE